MVAGHRCWHSSFAGGAQEGRQIVHADAVLEGVVLFTKHLDGHVVFHTEHSTWLLHVHVLL